MPTQTLQQLYDSPTYIRISCVLTETFYASPQVESVAFDIDYRSKVSRATFEEALADLKPSFTQPITDALNNAGLTLAS